MLKMTKIALEKDKYIFIEKGMRGGVSYINKRYSKASKNVSILYLDMKNLYGSAMSQYLPYANLKWVRNINEIEQKLMRIKSNSSTGYILEVDLECPKNCMICLMIIH